MLFQLQKSLHNLPLLTQSFHFFSFLATCFCNDDLRGYNLEGWDVEECGVPTEDKTIVPRLYTNDVKNVKSKIRLNQFTQFKILTFFHFHFSFIKLQRSIRQDNQI